MSAQSSPRQSNNVLSHWYALYEGVQFSAQEFYKSLEDELAARKLPRLQSSRVEHHEGSVLSDKRIYLRLARERYAFDVCAAPFGTGYFFSLRLIEKPRSWFQFIAILFLTSVLFVACLSLATNLIWGLMTFFGIMLGCAVALMIVRESSPPPGSASEPQASGEPHGELDAFTIMRGGGFAEGVEPDAESDKPASDEITRIVSVAPRGPTPRNLAPRNLGPANGVNTYSALDLDAILLDVAVIGKLYERVRKDTYFRYDTRMLFHTLVSDIVKRKVEELTAAKGVKLLQSYEYSPILGDLYKRATVAAPVKESEAVRHAVN